MKPTVRLIPVFDANPEDGMIPRITIAFDWYGQYQVERSLLCLYDNNYTPLYVATSPSVLPREEGFWSNKDRLTIHVIENYYFEGLAPLLQNGNSYYAQVIIQDVMGNLSEESDPVRFTCVAQPNFYFSYPVAKEGEHEIKIEQTAFTAEVKFYSKDFDFLNTYQFYLYDQQKKLVSVSGLLNNTSNRNNTVTHLYSGLINQDDTSYTNNTYYLRCTGTTVKGVNVDTDYYPIRVEYRGGAYTILYGKNEYDMGKISIGSNLIVISYEDPGKVFNLVDNKYIDLYTDEIHYNAGFVIPDNFTCVVVFRHNRRNCNLVELYNQYEHNKDAGYSIRLDTYDYYDGTRFILRVPNGLTYYTLFSEPLRLTDLDEVTVFIRKTVKFEKTDQVYTAIPTYDLEVYKGLAITKIPTPQQ